MSLHRNVPQAVWEKDSSVVALPTYLALRALFVSITRTTIVIPTMAAVIVAVFANVLRVWERDSSVVVLRTCLVLRVLFASITLMTVATPIVAVRIVAAFANVLYHCHVLLWIVLVLLMGVFITLKTQHWMLMDVQLTAALSSVVLLFLFLLEAVMVSVSHAVALGAEHAPRALRAWTILLTTVIPDVVPTVPVFASALLLVRVKDRHVVALLD